MVARAVVAMALAACACGGAAPRDRPTSPLGSADPATIRALLARYSPSGHAIVTAYEAMPTTFELPEGPYEVSSSITFDGYLRDGALERLVSYVTTAVHETTHGYLSSLGWQLLAERALPREPIPTLEEVLAATDLDLNIEIKVQTGDCSTTDRDQTAADVVAAIAADTSGRSFVVSSFDADVLTAVHDLEPAIYLGLLTLVPDDAAVAEARDFDALNLFSVNLRDRSDADAIRAHGLDVVVWTENGAFAIDNHLTTGVDMIITDEPEIVETVRAAWCDREGY